MKTNQLLPRLALTCLLALPTTFALGQALDSLSGATMNSKDSNWPIYNEDLILAPDGTFSATVTNNDGTFPASGTYVYAKQSAQTGKLSLSATPEGYSFNFTNVTQAENPTGFSHAAGTDGTKPLLVTFANSLTGMAIKTLPAATKGWIWFDEYPWVYSDEEKGWLYFKPSGDKLHYRSYRDKAWREFTQKQP